MAVIGSLAFAGPFPMSVRAQGGDTPQTRSQDREVQKLNALTTALRARNARDYAITTPNGIDEGEYVRIGGIDQWITIRGQDRRRIRGVTP
jgi:hypothetical protein